MTYTPTTEEVQEAWVNFSGNRNEGVDRESRSEFDTWFAAEEARIRADERAKIKLAIENAKSMAPNSSRGWLQGMDDAAWIAENS